MTAGPASGDHATVHRTTPRLGQRPVMHPRCSAVPPTAITPGWLALVECLYLPGNTRSYWRHRIKTRARDTGLRNRRIIQASCTTFRIDSLHSLESSISLVKAPNQRDEAGRLVHSPLPAALRALVATTYLYAGVPWPPQAALGAGSHSGRLACLPARAADSGLGSCPGRPLSVFKLAVPPGSTATRAMAPKRSLSGTLL